MNSARVSAKHFANFVDALRRKTDIRIIQFFAHSMGNTVLLEGLSRLHEPLAGKDLATIGHLVLAAPDIDTDVFVDLVAAVRARSLGITLHASTNDSALELSRRLAGGISRAGEISASGPVIIDGVDTIDVTAANICLSGWCHNPSSETVELLNDIARLFQTNERPPEKRVPVLRRVKAPSGGTYWRY
jgi:esterase/lipase superfamily enzyme